MAALSTMPGLEFIAVRKSFGAVKALTGVTFAVREGEAHALVGENGAGKSTLLKILAGIVRPDAGELRWNDARLSLGSPREALERGIGMVYQEMLSFPNLSVTGNIFAGRELIGAGGRLRERAMESRTVAILDELHLNIAPSATAETLPAAHRQLLQVARALAFECRILVLDEPTTALTDAEADHLFAVLDRLKARGVTLLYVSHRLPEVFRLCDRVTVLRDGGFAGTYDTKDVPPERIVRAMVGRDLPPRAEHAARATQGAPALAVKGLTRRPAFRHVSLTVAPGEIVGLFGLVGSGRSELLETIFGLRAPDTGTIHAGGRLLTLRSPRQAAREGIALVPEERHRQGLFFNLSVHDNLVMPARTVAGDILIRGAQERDASRRLLSDWRIKAGSPRAMPDSLSGGNQQKVVLAKWLATGPRILMLDEPTKGVDVGAKFEIHEIIRRQAAQGLGCLVASSDLPEVLALCHRVVVMREGRIQGELRGEAADEESVMHLATSELKDAS
ncbi:MAG TPA: sugar ABC transporter ATP-binding protein [Vicinamibacterales bacterium]|nr:sugar ABC transporter ATP-binding protein [Vicinamibacterales bacterium]